MFTAKNTINPESRKKVIVATIKETKNINIFLGNAFDSFVSMPGGSYCLVLQKNNDKYKNVPPPKRETGNIQIPMTVVGGWPAHETSKIPKQKILRTNDNKASNMKIITLISFLWDGSPYY